LLKGKASVKAVGPVFSGQTIKGDGAQVLCRLKRQCEAEDNFRLTLGLLSFY